VQVARHDVDDLLRDGAVVTILVTSGIDKPGIAGGERCSICGYSKRTEVDR
jgi:hypothetical protein